MAYIGNGRTLLVLGSNVRDDLLVDGTTSTFNLSQEVPGGYESNVYVFRQTYIRERVITSSPVIPGTPNVGLVKIRNVTGTTFEVYSDDDSISAALSSIRETIKTFPGGDHTLTITGSAVLGNNNQPFIIQSCVYNGTEIIITLTTTGAVAVDTESSLTLTHGYSGFWEVLEPEEDYTIGGTGSLLNKQITIPKVPSAQDKVYVVHKGDATYNLVPSDNSVGPNQLSQNLRDFSKQSFVTTSTITELALTQNSINSKAILVTIDGIVQEGEDGTAAPVSSSVDYALDTTVSPNLIRFRVPVVANKKIRILHLGFSTVSRRAVLSPGQVGSVGNDSIGTAQLKNAAVTESKLDNGAVTEVKISNGAITNTKIADNSVTSNKILLLNNTALRSLLSDGTTVQNLISVGTDNVTTVNSTAQVSIAVAGTKRLNVTSTEISSETTQTQTLGSATKQFTNLHLSGAANATSANITGNITVGGTVDGVDVSAFKSAYDLHVADILDTLVPIGTVMTYTGSAASGTLVKSRWLVCDGALISKSAYSSLYTHFVANSLNIKFGETVDQFRLPDLRRRVAIGRGSVDQIGDSDGLTDVNRLLTHSHTIPSHSHTMTHTHTLPAHYHTQSVLDTNTSGGTPGSVSSLRISSSGIHTTTTNIGHTHSNSTLFTGTTRVSSSNPAAVTTTNGAFSNITLTDPGHGHNWGTPGTAYHGNTVNSPPASGVVRTPAYSALLPNGGTTGDASLWSIVTPGGTAHSHGGSTNGMNSNITHSHAVGILGANSGAHGHNSNSARAAGTSTIAGGNTGSVDTDSKDINHVHTINSQDLDHKHYVSAALSGVYIDQTAHSHTIGDHVHSIPDITLGSMSVNASSNGAHSHLYTDFTGSIGNINGVSGDSTMTTQSQSISVTGLSDVLNSGSSNNTPYLILNHIIRAI
ncbi:MAG: tail fiber protein [Bacteroidota bacterium]|jgi:hypothetical protein